MKTSALSWLLLVSLTAFCSLIEAVSSEKSDFCSIFSSHFTRFQQIYDFDSHLTIQLFHALDASNPESFTSRGNISVLSINSGELAVNQKEITQKDRQLIYDLAKKDRFYRLKADVVGSDGIKTTFITSSKAVRRRFSSNQAMAT